MIKDCDKIESVKYIHPTGVVLINLGTPKAADNSSVRKYLAEFLNDPRVIDLPSPLRQFLVKGFILPFRPKTSARAYQQIWQPDGSPLLLNSQKLVKALSEELPEEFVVTLGMRYGKPSIADALTELKEKNCHKIIILPLFPQYASAATGSALEKTLKELQTYQGIPSVKWISSFYNHSGFIDAWAKIFKEHSQQHETPEIWIFSYHGLPVRQLNRLGCATTHCMAKIECENHTSRNEMCYRRQCFVTSELLAKAFALKPEQYRVAFQSRLGRTPWITPYTDQLLPELASQGVKRIGMLCPSFVADCLETLEEIGIRAKQQWGQLGGTHFTLLPCLNDHPAWVQGLKKILFDEKLSYNEKYEM